MSPTVTRPPTRPASPSNRPDDAVLSASLARALQNLPPNAPQEMYETHDTLPLKGDKDKLHSTLDIVVNSEQLILRGTGSEVEPVLLSGHVVLQLCEPTSIKEITLHFRGKAKMPPSSNDSMNMSASGFTYLVCDHDWSFLEGEKGRGHTLKAGRHLFPFHLQVGGSLPSSISTGALGGASVHYKLRASASRPGLAHNFQAVMPISIMRSFGSEALEYQQSLEIENTWPGKLMYSLMIPHKAWAAGDKLTALAKFSPIAKGVKVLNITSTIHETVKLYTRAGHQETSKIIVTAKHVVAGGKAVCTDEYQHSHRIPLLHYHHHGMPSSTNRTPQSMPGTPASPNAHHSPDSSSPNTSYFPSISGTESPPSASAEGSSSAGVTLDTVEEDQSESTEDPDTNQDIVTIVQLTIPKYTTPTHSIEPIAVSHRVRWNILIANLDGHTSELRCSLPLHILHHQMLQESINSTMLTRRLLLGEHDGPTEQEEEDVQLPSYPSHIRDRVPDVQSGSADHTPFVTSGARTPSSGLQSPAVVPSGHDHLPFVSGAPGAPDVTANPPLEWLTSELLRQQAASSGSRPSGIQVTPPESHPASVPGSRSGSRFQSRFPSRAPSPERGMRSLDSASPSASTVAKGVHETYFHSSSTASRNLHNLFHTSMKPFSSLTSPFSLSSRTSSHSHLANSTIPSHSRTQSDTRVGRASLSERPSPEQAPPLGPHNARFFTEVPDYEMASRGFAGGGVPPLSSMRGLPSYEEASSHIDTPSRPESPSQVVSLN